jgi:hypothetical protein
MIARLRGDSGWSGLMLVAGATGPEDAAALREAAGDALFLVPGYGAQGAGAVEAVAGFVKRGTTREGGVVNASRSVASPKGALGGFLRLRVGRTGRFGDRCRTGRTGGRDEILRQGGAFPRSKPPSANPLPVCVIPDAPVRGRACQPPT